VIPVLLVALWLAGVAFFRQTVPQPPAPVAQSSPPAALNTAADYLAQGDYDFDRGAYARALADYTRAIELDPASAEAYNDRAYTYMKMENYALALPDLDQALRLRPNYVNALMNRGDIHNYYYDINYGRAIADYDRVLAIDSQAANTTSVCGHRMLAIHHGWDLSVFGEVLIRGVNSGCTLAAPAY
jgi:tetratricopeptide (TPR) repeat protein